MSFFLRGRNDAHILPVIGEFLATVKANNIGAGLQGGRRATLSGLAAKGEAGALMGAAEQDVDDFQILLLLAIEGRSTYLVSTNPVPFHWFCQCI